MPLTVNVGLSRKSSENYNSQGASINLSAELDQSLLARPDLLHQQIQQLYREAEDALASQSQGNTQPRGERFNPNANGSRSTTAGAGRANSRSASNSGGSSGASSGVGGMTQSQRRAINAIAKQLGVDAAQEAQHELGIGLNELSVREASSLIEHLKSLQAQQKGGR